jgi:hypothetical protein
VYQTSVFELGKLAASVLGGLTDLRSVLTLLLLLLIGGSSRASEAVPWLYEVSVPVSSQSSDERNRASAEALLKLLTRLTGLAHVPRTEAVLAALDDAERYYSEFRYVKVVREGMDEDGKETAIENDQQQEPEEGLDLIIQFDAAPVVDLIRAAGLPIWRASRERVLAWIVIQDQRLDQSLADRKIVGSTPASPLTSGLEARAVDRGLVMTVPLLDLEDQLAVDPAAVWGRLSQVLDPASERYGADVLLLGRVVRLPGGGWESDWEFWVDGVVVPFGIEDLDLRTHGAEAVDVLADELAARRVVHGRQAGQLRLAVSGVATPADYGALLNYIRSLEFVDRVGVAGMENQRLWLLVDTPADPDRLLAAFQRDRRLYDDQLAMVDSADLRLVWRSGD